MGLQEIGQVTGLHALLRTTMDCLTVKRICTRNTRETLAISKTRQGCQQISSELPHSLLIFKFSLFEAACQPGETQLQAALALRLLELHSGALHASVES